MMAASPLWLGDRPLLLASGSATRRLMLESAGLPVETQRPVCDERSIEATFLASGGEAEEVAAALASAKAMAVSALNTGRWIVGADQTLTCEGRAFHKPEDLAAARRQLGELAGRTHTLTSAFALVRDGALVGRSQRRAHLTMRALDAGMLDAYLDLVGPAAATSVGAYQIEGPGVQLFEAIEGDHFTILGLPLLDLLAALRSARLLI